MPTPTHFDATAVQPLQASFLFYPHPTLFDAAAGDRFFPLGQIPGVFVLSTQYFEEEEEITLDAEKFLIIPAGKSKRISSTYAQVALAILIPA